MQRITITIDDDLLVALDKICKDRGYESRSEAIRDLLRDTTAEESSKREGRSALPR
jgi:CopG family transcriptional regulator, nickel-responsive regulator